MTYTKNFIFFPGGEQAAGNSGSTDNKDPKDNPVPIAETSKETTSEDKPVIEKIKEALQDWSNKDEADQEFDDTRV